MAKRSSRKLYDGWCKKCQSVRKFRVVGWNEEAELAWLRCSGCHSTFAFEIDRLKPDGTIADPPLEASQEDQDTTTEIVDYDPRNTYTLGQRIRHPVFQDVGRVIAVEKNGRSGKIVVDFENVGQKVLVEGRSLR